MGIISRLLRWARREPAMPPRCIEVPVEIILGPPVEIGKRQGLASVFPYTPEIGSVHVTSPQDFLGWDSYPGCPANQADFDLWTGKHITWGQGRHDFDEWPRLSTESLRQIGIAMLIHEQEKDD